MGHDKVDDGEAAGLLEWIEEEQERLMKDLRVGTAGTLEIKLDCKPGAIAPASRDVNTLQSSSSRLRVQIERWHRQRNQAASWLSQVNTKCIRTMVTAHQNRRC